MGSPPLTVVGSRCLLSGSPLERSMRIGASTALRLRARGGVDTHGALSDHLLSRCLGQPALCWPGPGGGQASLHVVPTPTKAAQSPGTVCPPRAPSHANAPPREATSLAGPGLEGPWAGRLHHCPRGPSPACGARCWKTVFRCRQEPSGVRNTAGEGGGQSSARDRTPEQPSLPRGPRRPQPARAPRPLPGEGRPEGRSL